MNEAIRAVLRFRGCDEVVSEGITEEIMHWRASELFSCLLRPRSYLMIIPRDITRLVLALLEGCLIAGSLFFADPRRWGRGHWDYDNVTSSSCTVYIGGRLAEYFTVNARTSNSVHIRYRNGHPHGWCRINVGDSMIEIRIVYYFMGLPLIVLPSWPNMVGQYWNIWNPDVPPVPVPKDAMTEWEMLRSAFSR